MAEHAEPVSRIHFLLRRLHSLTGIVPIGVFLIAHLTTNSTILWGVANGRAGGSLDNRRVVTFQEEVSFINEMPMLLLIELSLWGAIAFHSILGVVYAMSGKSNVRLYPQQNNWRYTLQRVSGYVGILFIFYHVATLRWGWTFLQPPGTPRWDHHAAASTLAHILRGDEETVTLLGFAMMVFYFVAVTMLVFHFANGLWTAAISWGLTVSREAQKRWGMVCAALGLGLTAAAWASVIGFATLDPNTAARIEKAHHAGEVTGASDTAVSETHNAEPADPAAEVDETADPAEQD